MPAVSAGIADGEEPEEGSVSKDMLGVSLPAEIKGIGKTLRVFFVEIRGVAITFALGFYRGVRMLELGFGRRLALRRWRPVVRCSEVRLAFFWS